MACQSNLRQIFMAVEMYCGESNDYYPPGAEDIEVPLPNNRGIITAGHWRWHGRRKNGDYPYDPRVGYLATYLGLDRKTVAEQEAETLSPEALLGEIRRLEGVKMCPSFVSFFEEGGRNAFEWGGGGYGYNCWSVGSKEAWMGSTLFWTGESNDSWKSGSAVRMFKDHVNTIMFADAAYAQKEDTPGGPRYYYTESHELVPPYYMESYVTDPVTWAPKPKPYAYGRPKPLKSWGLANPTIHFRHDGRCNVLWLDGHITIRSMDFSNPFDFYSGGHAAKMNVGWFGADDFSLWDYR